MKALAAAVTATPDTVTKHQLVDTLRTAKTKAAATALAALAGDETQPSRVRGAAILALGEIDRDVRGRLLADLKGLKDKDLSALAAALDGP